MRKFKTFDNFVESKKKELMDAKDGLAGEDYNGPLETKPEQNPGVGDVCKPLPYKNVSSDEANGKVLVAASDKETEGLALKATPNMTAKASSLGEKPENQVKYVKPSKMTSEQFIEKTKNMSDAEFAKFILGENHVEITPITDLHGNQFTPEPMQTIQYMTGILLSNPNMMMHFLRELKRKDGIQSLIEGLMDIPDSYGGLTSALGDDKMGEERCGRFAKAMNDNYMGRLDGIEIDIGENKNETVAEPPNVRWGPTNNSQKKPGGAFGGGSEPGPNPEFQGKTFPDNGGAFGGGGPETRRGQQGMQQQQPQFPPGKPLSPPNQSLKYMKAGVDDHLIKHMSGYGYMKDKMMKHCMNGSC